MEYILLIIGTGIIGFYIYLLTVGHKKYGSYIAGLSEEYRMKELYPAGFYFLELIHYPYNLKIDRKRRQQCTILYGERYGEFYFRLQWAQKASMMLLLLGVSILLCTQADDPVLYIIIPLFELIGYYYYDKQILKVTDSRDEEVERDFAEIISKLTLLINAGMQVYDAWVKVSGTGDSTLYKEMQTAVQEMKNGVSSSEAYMRFADRCMSAKVKKIMAAIIQNNAKGNRELVDYLLEQTDRCWEDKKKYLRIQGEKASGKLMIPIALMFVGIIIMVIVPIFANM